MCDKYLPETIVNLVLNQRTAIRYLRPGEMILQLFPGWWFQPSPLKNHGVSSSVGMIFHSQLNGKIIHVPNHQPAFVMAVLIGNMINRGSCWILFNSHGIAKLAVTRLGKRTPSCRRSHQSLPWCLANAA